jgi:hypothetical protein
MVIFQPRRAVYASQHEPSRLLRNAKLPGDPIGTDLAIGIRHHPDYDQPVVQRNVTVCEKRSRPDTELRPGMLRFAFPYLPGREKTRVRSPADRASHHAPGPAAGSDERNTPTGFREILDRFFQRSRQKVFCDRGIGEDSLYLPAHARALAIV